MYRSPSGILFFVTTEIMEVKNISLSSCQVIVPVRPCLKTASFNSFYAVAQQCKRKHLSPATTATGRGCKVVDLLIYTYCFFAVLVAELRRNINKEDRDEFLSLFHSAL